MIVPHPAGWPIQEKWVNGKNVTFASATHPSDMELMHFFDIEKPDIFFAVETPFSIRAFELAKNRGIKTVFYPMIERFPRQESQWQKIANDSTMIACPTMQCYEYFRNLYPEKTIYLRYPINHEYFNFRERKCCMTFLHNAGHGGVGLRKGTREVVIAFNMVKDDNARLIINSQKPIGYFNSVARLIEDDKRIEFRVVNTSNLNALYDDGDVAVQPSKFEGIGLTVPESMACGLPTITTNAAPMNEFVRDRDLLVDIEGYGPSISPNKDVGEAKVDINHLSIMMERMVGKDISAKSRQARKDVVDWFSWITWRDDYIKQLMTILS
jgi:glycosyltransferase involved in cell wall biosynthesis